MSLLSSTTEYFRGALTELHQVRWPTRHQAVRLSAIVIGFTLGAAFVYGFIDFFLGQGMALLLNFA